MLRTGTTRALTALALVAALAGCDDGRNPPLGGGGGGGGGGTTGQPDAGPGPDATEGAALVTGEICAVDDLRAPTACPDRPLGGLVVQERGTGNETLTAGSGAFALPVDGIDETILVAGLGAAGLQPGLVFVPLDGADVHGVIIPVVDDAYWTDLLTALGVPQFDDAATLALYPRSGGVPAAGVDVLGPDGAAYPPFYDGGAALSWREVGPTAAAGAALVFGVNPGAGDVTVTLLRDDDLEPRPFTLPVAAGAVTFAILDVTP